MKKNNMDKAIKDAMAVVISETTGQDTSAIRKWLETVKTAEDFFGANNRQGLNEYKHFVASRENAYKAAQKRQLKKV